MLNVSYQCWRTYQVYGPSIVYYIVVVCGMLTCMLLGSLTAYPGQRTAGAQLGHPANHLWGGESRVYRLRVCAVAAAERSRQLPGRRPEQTAGQVVRRSGQTTRLPWRPAAEDYEQARYTFAHLRAHQHTSYWPCDKITLTTSCRGLWTSQVAAYCHTYTAFMCCIFLGYRVRFLWVFMFFCKGFVCIFSILCYLRSLCFCVL